MVNHDDGTHPTAVVTTDIHNPGRGAGRRPRIGVLGLQGGVAEHVRMFESLGADTVTVRTARALTEQPFDGLVLPGGESSTVDRLLSRFGMREPLLRLLQAGTPVLGTCAGLILLADQVEDPAPGQESLGVIPMTVRRNAFGRQVDSATETLDTTLGAVQAAFIRAPEVISVGPGVEVLARRGSAPNGEGAVVAVAAGNAVALSFHPELTGDVTLHEEFLRRIASVGCTV